MRKPIEIAEAMQPLTFSAVRDRRTREKRIGLRFLLFTLLAGVWVQACYSQGADLSTDALSSTPLRLFNMQQPEFGFYVRVYPKEGENGGPNSVSYLGWNVLGLDSTDAGMWLNFEHDYHGWFEHNMDVRTAAGAFVRRMKTAVDRNTGTGISKSWAFDHITFHHGRTDAGGDAAQVDFTLDASPDFTLMNIRGQILGERRIVSKASVRRIHGSASIDWKSSNVVDVHIEGPAELRFINILEGQQLTVIVRNPERHPVIWQGELRWPGGRMPSPQSTLLRYNFLAIEGLILAEHPLEY
jgi:hypothetical protein